VRSLCKKLQKQSDRCCGRVSAIAMVILINK
jgi:hypothetical protein